VTMRDEVIPAKGSNVSKGSNPLVTRAGPIAVIAILVVLAAAPALGLSDFHRSLAIEAMMFSILAMSLNLILGYAGLVSFGHAAFFAIGAYAAGLAANAGGAEIWLSFPIAIATGVLLAIPIGWLSIRLSGFYFLMITFAFAQMVHSVAFRWNWLTGGSDGLLIAGPKLLGSPILQSRSQLYFFALVCTVVTFLVMAAIVGSPFGQVLVGIRENTMRMRALGYNVRAYKLAAFVVAAAFAALAGYINAQFSLFVAPDSADWTQSASVLVMVLIGGAGTLTGPIIGATVVLLLQHWLSSYTQYWSLVLGLIFIALITVARDGLHGIALRLWATGRAK
jgi:branched-chain amino acid transport system permease protein